MSRWGSLPLQSLLNNLVILIHIIIIDSRNNCTYVNKLLQYFNSLKLHPVAIFWHVEIIANFHLFVQCCCSRTVCVCVVLQFKIAHLYILYTMCMLSCRHRRHHALVVRFTVLRPRQPSPICTTNWHKHSPISRGVELWTNIITTQKSRRAARCHTQLLALRWKVHPRRNALCTAKNILDWRSFLLRDVNMFEKADLASPSVSPAERCGEWWGASHGE